MDNKRLKTAAFVLAAAVILIIVVRDTTIGAAAIAGAFGIIGAIIGAGG
jgi:hypothetical protein